MLVENNRKTKNVLCSFLKFLFIHECFLYVYKVFACSIADCIFVLCYFLVCCLDLYITQSDKGSMIKKTVIRKVSARVYCWASVSGSLGSSQLAYHDVSHWIEEHGLEVS